MKVHLIRDAMWVGVPPELGSDWLRVQSPSDTWQLHLAVPTAGGLAVGLINSLRAKLKSPKRKGPSSKRKEHQQAFSPPAAAAAESGATVAASAAIAGETQPLSETLNPQPLALEQTGRSAFLIPPRHVGEEEEGESEKEWKVKTRAVLRPALKALAAAVTLGSGNSLGPEGPSVEIGSAIGRGTGGLMQGSRERTIALVAAGSAAGIASGMVTSVCTALYKPAVTGSNP